MSGDKLVTNYLHLVLDPRLILIHLKTSLNTSVTLNISADS